MGHSPAHSDANDVMLGTVRFGCAGPRWLFSAWALLPYALESTRPACEQISSQSAKRFQRWKACCFPERHDSRSWRNLWGMDKSLASEVWCCPLGSGQQGRFSNEALRMFRKRSHVQRATLGNGHQTASPARHPKQHSTNHGYNLCAFQLSSSRHKLREPQKMKLSFT